MRAVVCREFGAELAVEERDPISARPGQVVIDVAASGVNYVDALFVRGEYQIKPPLPFVPGMEAAGTVSQVGEGVAGFSPGDRVLAMTGTGAFASQVAASATQTFPIPEQLGFGQAATFVQSYCTALFSLRERGRLQAGETLLVLGAAGGVGRAAIDVGKALGARVIAAASTDEKLEACRKLGADALVCYAREDLKTRAREESGGGVDVAFDPVGGELSEQALRALAYDGRLLVIGFAAGPIPRLPANQVLLRNRSVVGVDWGAWMLAHADQQRSLMEELLQLASKGELRPAEPTPYPLERAGAALADLRARKLTGKAALVP